jgi:hypothetical protein
MHLGRFIDQFDLTSPTPSLLYHLLDLGREKIEWMSRNDSQTYRNCTLVPVHIRNVDWPRHHFFPAAFHICQRNRLSIVCIIIYKLSKNSQKSAHTTPKIDPCVT